MHVDYSFLSKKNRNRFFFGAFFHITFITCRVNSFITLFSLIQMNFTRCIKSKYRNRFPGNVEHFFWVYWTISIDWTAEKTRTLNFMSSFTDFQNNSIEWIVYIYLWTDKDAWICFYVNRLFEWMTSSNDCFVNPRTNSLIKWLDNQTERIIEEKMNLSLSLSTPLQKLNVFSFYTPPQIACPPLFFCPRFMRLVNKFIWQCLDRFRPVLYEQ